LDNIFAIELLSWTMDRALATHSVARINIANASVENYVPMKLSFDAQLSALKQAANNGDIELKFLEIDQNINQMMSANSQRLFGESVALDVEVTTMVKNSGYYQTLANIMSRKMGLLSMVISGRG